MHAVHLKSHKAFKVKTLNEENQSMPFLQPNQVQQFSELWSVWKGWQVSVCEGGDLLSAGSASESLFKDLHQFLAPLLQSLYMNHTLLFKQGKNETSVTIKGTVLQVTQIVIDCLLMHPGIFKIEIFIHSSLSYKKFYDGWIDGWMMYTVSFFWAEG